MHTARTCPNCHQLIDLELALQLSGWSKLAPTNFGVSCPNCKMILAVRQRGGFAAFWVVVVAVSALALLGTATGYLSRINVLLIESGLGVFAVYMVRWRLRSPIELSVPPAGVDLREVLPSEKEYAYREGRQGRGMAFQIDPASKDAHRPEWVCGNCNQPNPSAFDLCWKCNHSRPSQT